MKFLATLGTTKVVFSKAAPEVLADLFWSVWAQRAYGATPDLVVGEKEVPVGTLLFILGDEKEGLCGGVLVDEMNRAHNRFAIHVAILPGMERLGHAWRGILAVSAIMCETFGYERISTYSFPRSPGATVAEAMGMKPEGRMEAFTLTPEGRKDMLIFGGLYSNLKKIHGTEIASIIWETPNGTQNDDRARIRDVRSAQSTG